VSSVKIALRKEETESDEAQAVMQNSLELASA
jgi:hypothetical protein